MDFYNGLEEMIRKHTKYKIHNIMINKYKIRCFILYNNISYLALVTKVIDC